MAYIASEICNEVYGACGEDFFKERIMSRLGSKPNKMDWETVNTVSTNIIIENSEN